MTWRTLFRSGGRVSDPWLGKLVGSCRIESKIGEGGCGQVFRGLDTMLERPVAIKVLHPALAARNDIAKRFRSEALALARFGHPNIATLYSFHQVADTYLMVMEFIEGETFEELLKRDGPMPATRATALLLQALDGIEHAHRHGVIHRDLKATNLMVNGAGIVKVMDFGVARALDTDGVTQANQPLGTPEYMSPEQVRGEELDARSDFYAIGVLLYKMLTGRLPIRGESPFAVMQAQVESEPHPLRDRVPDISTGLEAAVARALSKKREDRFESAASFRAALEAAIADGDAITLQTPATPLPTIVDTEITPPGTEPPPPTRITPETGKILPTRAGFRAGWALRAAGLTALAAATFLAWGWGARRSLPEPDPESLPVLPEVQFTSPDWISPPESDAPTAADPGEPELDPASDTNIEPRAQGSEVAIAKPVKRKRATSRPRRSAPKSSPRAEQETPASEAASEPGWVIER